MKAVSTVSWVLCGLLLTNCGTPPLQSRIDRVLTVDGARFGPAAALISDQDRFEGNTRVVVHRGLSDRVLAERYPSPAADGRAVYTVGSQEALRAAERALQSPMSEPDRAQLKMLRDELALFEYKRRRAISAQSGLGSWQYRRTQRMIHQ